MTPRHLGLALSLAAALGCARDDLVASELPGGSPTGPASPIDVPDPGPAPTTIPAPDPSPAPSTGSSCPWTGPPVLADGTCTGALAQRVFTRAACACGALSLGGDLVTDGFDSRVGPWAPGGGGAGVGAITGLSAGGLLDVGGSLAVSGGGVDAGGRVAVVGDLDVGGPLGGTRAAVTVGGSARIGGDLRVASLSVTGSLTTAPGAVVTGTISAGSRATGAVSLPPACPCGAADAVDVAAIVAQHRSANDNAAIGLGRGDLGAVYTNRTLALPCGRFYLDGIQGAALLTLRVKGRTALFVGAGGLAFAGQLAITLDPGAELDLFVAGPVSLPATLRLGDPARPSALRLWLATADVFQVPVDAALAANVYAPAATLAVGAPLALHGAVLAGGVRTSAALTIHHDRAIAASAATCGP